MTLYFLDVYILFTSLVKLIQQIRVCIYTLLLCNSNNREWSLYGHVWQCLLCVTISAFPQVFGLPALHFRAQNVQMRKCYVALVDSVKDSGGDVKIFSSLHVSGERG